MAGSIPNTIVPSVTSGNQLATILNDWVDAYASQNAGNSRPGNIAAGGLWVDTTNDPEWVLKIYNGSTDTELLTFDKSTGSISLSDQVSPLSINRETDDSVGSLLTLFKKRIAGGGQTLQDDTLGRIDFDGFDDAASQATLARISSLASENTTAASQGADMRFFVTEDGQSALSEAMRISAEKFVGVGNTTPDKKLHVSGQSTNAYVRVDQTGDDTDKAGVQIVKSRTSNGGQVLANDYLGEVLFDTTDDTSAERTAVSIQAQAQENVTNSQNGTDLIFSTTNDGATTTSEKLRLDNEGALVSGEFRATGDVTFSGTGAVKLTSGTEAQRPGSPVVGMIRYNSDSGKYEGYTADGWEDLDGKGGVITQSLANNSGPTDVGAAGVFEFDPSTVSVVLCDYRITRRTDSNNVIEAGKLALIYDTETSSWRTPDGTSFGDDADTIFTMSTVSSGPNTGFGKLQYTTGDLTGASYSGELKITNIRIINQ